MAGRTDGSNVYYQASRLIGTEWGSHNCTGFVFTVSAKEGHKFRPHPTDPVGPKLSNGQLINQIKSDGKSYYGDYNYDPPISDKGQVKQEDYSDNWVRVNSGSTDWARDISAGDLVRIKIIQSNGVGIYHSGVVSAYDDQQGTLYLVDNWAKNSYSTYNPKSAIISVSSFSSGQVDTGAPIAVYRLNSSSTTQLPSKDDSISGTAAPDTLGGGAGNDTIYGGGGNDRLYGNGDNDSIYGDANNDTLYGGTGNDILYGGTGNDILYGGTDNDDFIFAFIKDTAPGGYADWIMDFQGAGRSGGDRIDLRGIDANETKSGDQPFSSPVSAFSTKDATAQMTVKQAGSTWVVSLSTDKDVDPEAQIIVKLSDGGSLTDADFIL